mgnify:CR=1 FL=1
MLSLAKGEKTNLLSLTKNNSLKHVDIGVGWDPIFVDQPKPSGFLGKMFGGNDSGRKQIDVDIDASVVLLNEQGRVQNKNDDLIYFGHLSHSSGSVKHSGDNRTGAGDGDDEVISVYLDRLPSYVHKILVVVNIYNCERSNQHFGMIEKAQINIYDKANNSKLVQYNLTDNYQGKTSILVASLVRNGSDFEFEAIGEGGNATSLSHMVRSYS